MTESAVGKHVCTQCGNYAHATPLRNDAGETLAGYHVSCEICGQYGVSEEQETNCRNLATEQRFLLSAITRTAAEKGKPLLLRTEIADHLRATTPWPSFVEQENLFLGYVASRAPKRGDAVPIRHNKDYPLFFAKGSGEVDFIARGLVEAGLVERVDQSELPRYRPTREGYAELERRKVAAPPAATRTFDPLTGLLDKGAYMVDVRTLAAAALRDRTPLALLIADVDHFKQVNDTRGHDSGDKVLCGLAQRLQHTVIGKGSVYRWGGEEIAVLLPNHSRWEAVSVAERMRREVAESPIADLCIKISVGVAVLPEHAGDEEQLFRAADSAVYDAKKRGRDLVRYCGEPEPQRPGPREAERKAPEPGGLTEEQLTEFRKQALHGQTILCPLDGAAFHVEDITSMGSVGREFHIRCTDCGLSATLSGPSRR
jgi:diguanylate cyclase (GGDEF)-like protein